MSPKDITALVRLIQGEFQRLRDAVSNQRIVTDISGAASSFDNAAKKLNTSADALEKAVKSQDISSIQKQLIQLIGSISMMTKKVGEVKYPDQKPIHDLLKRVVRSIERKKIETNEVDMSKLDDVLKVLYNISAQLMESKEPLDRTDEIIEAIQKIKITVPESLKLDQSQVRTIVHGGGSGAGASYPQMGTSASVDMTSANTEYSYKFPSNTIGFRVKLRDQGVLMLYSWQTGTMPTSGDGSAYSTLQQNSEVSRDNLDIGGKTIYFQSASASMVAEIESFQMK